jgi:hypothetical protein
MEQAEIEEELKSAVEQSEMSNKKLQRYKARVERKIREVRREAADQPPAAASLSLHTPVLCCGVWMCRHGRRWRT